MNDQITVHVRMPRKAHTKVRLLAIKKGMTIGEVLAEAIKKV